MIQLIRQPEGSSLCGQACVAMVAGVTLERAIAVFEHKHATYTRELVAALRKLNVACGDRCKRVSRIRPILPARAILSITRFVKKPNGKYRRYGHWMVTWDGVIYDPEDNWPDLYRVENWNVTSYLEILS
jgi:hypothetical protein